MKQEGHLSQNAARIEAAAAAWLARRDAGLNAREDAELQTWLAADPRHRTAFGEYASAWSLLDRPAQGGATNALLVELQRLDRGRRRRRLFAGGLAAVLLMGGVSQWTLTHRTKEAVAATTRTWLPERQTLGDNSIIELKEGAQISVHFDARQRRVVLRQGEAHFQVAKDVARPFIVEANGVELRAVGTAFAVQIGAAAVEVIVTEGTVVIDSSLNATPTTVGRAVVSPGQRARIEPGAATSSVRALGTEEMSERLAWRAPRLEFSGTPLREVVALLNQHAAGRRGARLILGDNTLEVVRVSGLFRADNSAALLDLLESGFGITAERISESEVILRHGTAAK